MSSTCHEPARLRNLPRNRPDRPPGTFRRSRRCVLSGGSRPAGALGTAMVALGLVGLWPLGLAAAVGAPEAVAPAELPSLGFSVLRLIGALGFVLALFFGGIWLVRNWRRLAHRPSASSELRLLEVRSLGARQALWLVGYHRQRLLVASSPAGVTLVAALPEAEAEAPAPPVGSDFSAVFQQLLHRAS